MTKRHFTIFAEVCRQMSFSKAAEALNTTQPTVSLAVKELEEHYGVRLFERMNRRIYMTEAGRALLSTAQEVLRGFQQAEDQLRKAPYRLRVGANVTFGATRLPRVLASSGGSAPRWSFPPWWETLTASSGCCWKTAWMWAWWTM